MKTLKTLLVMLILSSLALSNCKKDCVRDEDLIMDVYPETAKKGIPYTGTETLRFLKNQQDTISFQGEGKKISYTREQTQSPCIEFERLQNINVSFHSTETDQRIAYDYYVRSRAFSNGKRVSLKYNRQEIGNYDQVYFVSLDGPPAKKDSACGVTYDSVSLFSHKLGSLTFKPKFGIIKFSISTDLYELIPPQ